MTPVADFLFLSQTETDRYLTPWKSGVGGHSSPPGKVWKELCKVDQTIISYHQLNIFFLKIAFVAKGCEGQCPKYPSYLLKEKPWLKWSSKGTCWGKSCTFKRSICARCQCLLSVRNYWCILETACIIWLSGA